MHRILGILFLCGLWTGCGADVSEEPAERETAVFSEYALSDEEPEAVFAPAEGMEAEAEAPEGGALQPRGTFDPCDCLDRSRVNSCKWPTRPCGCWVKDGRKTVTHWCAKRAVFVRCQKFRWHGC